MHIKRGQILVIIAWLQATKYGRVATGQGRGGLLNCANDALMLYISYVLRTSVLAPTIKTYLVVLAFSASS